MLFGPTIWAWKATFEAQMGREFRPIYVLASQIARSKTLKKKPHGLAASLRRELAPLPSPPHPRQHKPWRRASAPSRAPPPRPSSAPGPAGAPRLPSPAPSLPSPGLRPWGGGWRWRGRCSRCTARCRRRGRRRGWGRRWPGPCRRGRSAAPTRESESDTVY